MSSKPVKKEDSTVLTEILNLKDVGDLGGDINEDPQNKNIQNKFDSALNDLMPTDDPSEIDFLATGDDSPTEIDTKMPKEDAVSDSPGFSLDIEAPTLEFEATGQIESSSLDLGGTGSMPSIDSGSETSGIEMDFTDSSLDLGLGDLQASGDLDIGAEGSGISELDLGGDDDGLSFNTGTGTSGDLISSEEAKTNIEKTIAGIVAPKNGETGEFSLDSLVEEEQDESTRVANPMNQKSNGTDSFDLDFSAGSGDAGSSHKTAQGFDDDILINQAVNTEIDEKTASGFIINTPAAKGQSASSDSISRSAPEARRSSLDEDFSNRREINDDEYVRLQATIRQLREEREELLENIKTLKSDVREYEQDNLTLKAVLDETKIEVSILRKRHLTEIEDYKYRLSMSDEKKAFAEEKMRNLEKVKEKLEQKARIDIGQIRQREKELESKLELLSMDVDSQVHSRDQKILELRRKIDSLEFNMENATIREQKSIEDKKKLEDKLNKIMKTLRNSIKNLEDDIEESAEIAVRPEKKHD